MDRPTFPAPYPHDPKRSVSRHAWHRRSSPLSRYALLAYVLVVVDASLYPFSGWRDLGLAPYAYLSAAWPPRALPFDLIVNGLGYLPLGFFAGLAVHPRLRGVATIVVATLLCAVLSVHLEALQSYLPTRVASKVDVLANVGGGVVGALFAARFAHALLDTGRLRAWRARWFAGDASRGLVLVLVWFGALVYPDAFVLGTGGLLKAFDPTGSDLIAGAVGLADAGDPVATAMRFQLAESAVTSLTFLGAGLLFLNLMRAGLAWPKRFGLLVLFMTTTVSVVAFARLFLSGDIDAWPLLTPGARVGLVVAAIGLLLGTLLPTTVRWILGLAALVVALVLVNIYPDNPYGSALNLSWTRGKLLNFYGLASGLNLVWPYLAIAWFLRHRGSHAGAAPRRKAVAAKVVAARPSL